MSICRDRKIPAMQSLKSASAHGQSGQSMQNIKNGMNTSHLSLQKIFLSLEKVVFSLTCCSRRVKKLDKKKLASKVHKRARDIR